MNIPDLYIKAAALKIKSIGKIFVGRCHADLFKYIKDNNIHLPEKCEKLCGFINNYDEFLIRTESCKIAQAANQITNMDPGPLFSEEMFGNKLYELFGKNVREININ